MKCLTHPISYLMGLILRASLKFSKNFKHSWFSSGILVYLLIDSIKSSTGSCVPVYLKKKF